MFDLFRSRDKAVRIMLGGLLLLVALSMLTYLIPSYGTGADPNDVIIAEVGKDTITLPEVQRLVQNYMRGRQLPPEILPNFLPGMIDQMVTDRALAYEAQRLGFEVTDAQLRDAIKQNAPALFPDGKFVGAQVYQGFLAQQNLTIAEFEADFRRQLLATRMREVALEGTIVTPMEIEQQYRKKNEKVKIEFVKLVPDKYKAEVQPSLQDMQAFFKANAMRYTTPEKKNLAILIADQLKLEDSIPVNQADLRRLYTQNLEQFRTPDRVKIRQIVLNTQGKTPAEEAQVKAKADDLVKQLRAGADFAALAKKNSEDPTSAANGGNVADWLTHGQFSSQDFERVAFSLQPGQTSDPVKDYAYHIIQVTAKEPARVRPFEEVEPELTAAYKKQRANDLMQQISDRAHTDLAKDPLHPEKIAADYKMQLVNAEVGDPGKTIPEVGPNPEFDQAVANLKQGEVSQPITLGPNKLALVVVTGITPAKPANFEDVQNQVKDAIVANRLTVAVQNHAKELMDKATAMGGNLAAAAKSMGLDVKTSDEFSRTDSVTDLGNASYVQEAFTRPDGAVFGPVSTGDSTVVAKVIAHIQPDMSKLAEQRVQIRDDIKGQKGRDRNALFDAGVRDMLIKQGKVKYHQDTIARLISSYTGHS